MTLVHLLLSGSCDVGVTSFQCLAKRMCVGNVTAESSPCFVVMPY